MKRKPLACDSISHLKEACAQLEARPVFSPSIWGPNPQRQQVARIAGQIIRECQGWPNDRFLPEDPMKALLCPDGDVEIAEWALTTIAERLDLDPDFNVPNLQGTFGDLVDLLMDWLPEPLPPLWPFEGRIALERRDCPPRDVFRDLCSLLRQWGYGHKRRLRPSTKLFQVMPFSQARLLRPYIECRFGCSLRTHARVLGRLSLARTWLVLTVVLAAWLGIQFGATIHLAAVPLLVWMPLAFLSRPCFRDARTLGDLARLIVKTRTAQVAQIPFASAASPPGIAGRSASV